MRTMGGLLSAIHVLVGTDVTGSIVEGFVDKLVDNGAIGRSTDGGGDTPAPELAGSMTKESKNIVLLLAALYNLGAVHSKLVYGLLQRFLARLHESDVDLILAVLRAAGPKLRADDPAALRDVILLAQSRAAEVREAHPDAEAGEEDGEGSDGEGDDGEGGGSLSKRTQFMLEAIYDLKNNKSRNKKNSGGKGVDVAGMEHVKKLKRWVGHLASKVGQSKSEAKSVGSTTTTLVPLRASLDDLCDAETKGRWWVAGAPWQQRKDGGGGAGGGAAGDGRRSSNNQLSSLPASASLMRNADVSDERWAALERAAVAQRMSSGIQKVC